MSIKPLTSVISIERPITSCVMALGVVETVTHMMHCYNSTDRSGDLMQPIIPCGKEISDV